MLIQLARNKSDAIHSFTNLDLMLIIKRIAVNNTTVLWSIGLIIPPFSGEAILVNTRVNTDFIRERKLIRFFVGQKRIPQVTKNG